jgi:gamma-glutamyl:cysteine ligase YbdK (ATP-grasp superfamily)
MNPRSVAVLDRAGPWLAILLALSANSPFWQETDSAVAITGTDHQLD